MAGTTYGFDKATVLKLKADHLRLKGMVDNLKSSAAHDRKSQPWNLKRVRFRNDSDETIPPCGAMKVTGSLKYDDLTVITVDQPDTTFSNLYLLNGPSEVVAGDDGFAQPMTQYVQGHCDSTPAYGEGWGVKPGEWKLFKGYPGGVIVDVGADERMGVLEWRPMTNLIGKSDGAIGKGGAGTMKIYKGTAGSLSDSTMTVGVYNIFGDVADDIYIAATWMNNAWYIVASECSE